YNSDIFREANEGKKSTFKEL
ncbi:conjugal transfer protein TraY, partial [Salmonella enterica subsp. enterica serovar Reading]|nr:conjugal transfer protein TraY [Salmonella enterica subsp. enterica serovar Reading]